ncbi:MAG: hypothetical protein GAK43_00441 [Stenotrophomonas maltophilia]|nr:MAG: hypothetical protein GAK43_00441 [Stenotrophomonas maltophilia]
MPPPRALLLALALLAAPPLRALELQPTTLQLPAGQQRTELWLDNPGALHARLADLVFEAADGRRSMLLPGLAGYVLAGQQRRWALPARADGYAGGRFLARLQDGAEQLLGPAQAQIAPAANTGL